MSLLAAQRPRGPIAPVPDLYHVPRASLDRVHSTQNRRRKWSRWKLVILPNVDPRSKGAINVGLQDATRDLLIATVDELFQSKARLAQIFEGVYAGTPAKRARRAGEIAAPRVRIRDPQANPFEQPERDYREDQFNDQHVFQVTYTAPGTEIGRRNFRVHMNMEVMALHDSAFRIRTKREDPNAIGYHFSELWNALLYAPKWPLDPRIPAHLKKDNPIREAYRAKLRRNYARPNPPLEEGRPAVNIMVTGEPMYRGKQYFAKDTAPREVDQYSRVQPGMKRFREDGVQRGNARLMIPDVQPDADVQTPPTSDDENDGGEREALLDALNRYYQRR